MSMSWWHCMTSQWRQWYNCTITMTPPFNTLGPRQNGCHFADDTFQRIFMNENVRILVDISLKFVPKGLITNIPALVQIMAWPRPGDKPLSEPMMVNLLKHRCVTRPQWVKYDVSLLVLLDCTHAMMTSSNGNIFRVTGPLLGEPTVLRWIPLTKGSDADLWCFLWSVLKETVEQKIETLVIWDAIEHIMMSL